MTILFDATAPVKSSRKFGAGIHRSLPTYRAPFTEADLAWLREDDARRAAEDRELDMRAEEAEALRRIENGWL